MKIEAKHICKKPRKWSTRNHNGEKRIETYTIAKKFGAICNNKLLSVPLNLYWSSEKSTFGCLLVFQNQIWSAYRPIYSRIILIWYIAQIRPFYSMNYSNSLVSMWAILKPITIDANTTKYLIGQNLGRNFHFLLHSRKDFRRFNSLCGL